LEHKKHRNIHLGDHILLIFEDELTIRYQVQEMLRIEKVFEAEGIQDELDAYNPLIPDGDNWKCTMMIQYGDVEERRLQLGKLIGIEDKIWVQVGDNQKIYAIADEDLERDSEEKTSAVHFMRYQLDDQSIRDAKSGTDIIFGIEHPEYTIDAMRLSSASRDALAADLA